MGWVEFVTVKLGVRFAVRQRDVVRTPSRVYGGQIAIIPGAIRGRLDDRTAGRGIT